MCIGLIVQRNIWSLYHPRRGAGCPGRIGRSYCCCFLQTHQKTCNPVNCLRSVWNTHRTTYSLQVYKPLPLFLSGFKWSNPAKSLPSPKLPACHTWYPFQHPSTRSDVPSGVRLSPGGGDGRGGRLQLLVGSIHPVQLFQCRTDVVVSASSGRKTNK